jgi:type VI secretion system VasD/TssJ family lipoprotein
MLKKFVQMLIVTQVLLMVICACASKPSTSYNLPPDLRPEWRFERNAVQVGFKAVPQLNFSDGIPHHLSVCLYQLRDPNAFNQLGNDVSGLYRLLECGVFDAGVASSKRLDIQPGGDLEVTLDRAEGARYIGIAAGYYQLEKARIIKLVEIPVVVKRKGLLWRKKYSRPAPLKLEISLGPLQIEDVVLSEKE